MSVSEKGRRRRRLDDEGEDEGVANAIAASRPSECESEGEPADVDLSEYESAVDESADQEETEGGSESGTEEGSETEETGSDTETEGGEGYTDEEGLEEERQSGDGEEQPDKDKPDDDEDKKNPAYVPRKGAFYEHDFRMGDGPEGEEAGDAQPKKKLWQDEGKWAHDRYIDDMQAPKSREELIALYGYDIRAADKPPDAPPKRLGKPRGPRKQQRFQDFMPRMAVIDTTEDGSDSVPNLGDDDELILFNEPPSRQDRRNNARNYDNRRGRRGGGGRGGGPGFQSSDVDSQNERNRNDRNNRYNESRSGSDMNRNSDYAKMRDTLSRDDFPSLPDSTRPAASQKEDRNEKRPQNYDRPRGDARPANNERDQKSYQSNARDGYSDDDYKGNRYQQSQDSRGQFDNRGGSRYQQSYRDDRRGGYTGRSGPRGGGNYGKRVQEENWRSGPRDFREGNRNDGYDRGGRGGGNQNSGYNRRQQYSGGEDRGPIAGNSGDAGGFAGSNRHGNRGYEQPPRYQQQQQQQPMQLNEPPAAISREYTNSSYKAAEERNRQRGGVNSAAAAAGATTTSTTTTNVTDSGDGSVSSKNVVISNKENVQTINVTITSTTTEKKSYAKERRAKGAPRPTDSSAMLTGPEMPATAAPVTGNQYQGLPPSTGMVVDPNSGPAVAGAKRYSSQRQQQGLGKGVFTEPPPVDNSGAKLYNPAMPPPSFFREPGTVGPGHHPSPSSSATVQEPTHFTPALLPPAAALPFGLPVSSAGLPIPPTPAGIPTNPALFQPQTGPPPSSIPAPGPGLMAPPYLPAGMIYGGAPRVPPPGTPAGFPLPMAYTSPPPPSTVTPTAVVSQQPPQVSAPQQGLQSTGQHKKVYRGDITYYAPELQQPSRTPQKRPKAAIPIIDPQEMRQQKQKESSELRNTPEKSTASSTKQPPQPATSTSSSNNNKLAQSSAIKSSDLVSVKQERPQHQLQQQPSAGRPEGGAQRKSPTATAASATAATTPTTATNSVKGGAAAVKSEPKPSSRPQPVSSASTGSADKPSSANPQHATVKARVVKTEHKSEASAGAMFSNSSQPGSAQSQGKDAKSDLSQTVATQSFKSEIVKTETNVGDESQSAVKAPVVPAVEIKKEKDSREGVAESKPDSSAAQAQPLAVDAKVES